jgi:N-acetylmuramoyl-L-alanine amidase
MGSGDLLFNCTGWGPAGRGRPRLALALAVLWALFLTLPGLAQEALPQVLAARVSTTPERGRLVVDLSTPTEFAIATLANPDRIAVDVRASAVAITEPQSVAGTGIIASFSTAMAEAGRARTELRLNQPAVVQQAYVLDPIGDQPARLVVDLITTTPSDFAARAAADLASARAREGAVAATASSEAPSSAAPGSSAAEAASSNAVDAASSSAAEVASGEASSLPASSSEATPASASSSEELAADVPLAYAAPAPLGPDTSPAPAVPGPKPTPGSRPLIVIDPGHGGIDNGASAPSGVHEKDITLAFALQLRDLLVKTGLFDVAMTRQDDTYLSLNDRVNLARQNKADLFISLHADTFQESDIRGASIYTRDEQATDILDKVLADGENRADIVAGYVKPDTKPQVVDVLVDLMRREVRQQAYIAAQDILRAMQPGVALRRFPLRKADFFVLQAPDIPSMLIELGFLSNNADINNLENVAWRDKAVSAIARGIETYFAGTGTTVAGG